MSTELQTNKRTLPTLAQLHESNELFFKNDQLNTLLNQPPHKDFIKKHPIYNNSYVPVDKVEMLLTRLFQRWRIEVLQVQQLFQSVCVSIRLHYWNPAAGEWDFMDGVGAAEVQVDKGESAANMGAIKSNAIMIAAPKAKTAALKDAAANLGTVFGKDLNRKDTMQFQPYSGPQAGAVNPIPAQAIVKPMPSNVLETFSDL